MKFLSGNFVYFNFFRYMARITYRFNITVFRIKFPDQILWSNFRIKFRGWITGYNFVVKFLDQILWSYFSIKFRSQISGSNFLVKFQDQISWSNFGTQFLRLISVSNFSPKFFTHKFIEYRFHLGTLLTKNNSSRMITKSGKFRN